MQYIGGYRDLHYTNSLSTSGRNFDFDGDERQQVIRGNLADPDGPLADEFIRERYYGNYSALIWDAKSESRTHELRFTSPDSAERITWAVGLYKFKEEQGGACSSAFRSTTRPTSRTWNSTRARRSANPSRRTRT